MGPLPLGHLHYTDLVMSTMTPAVAQTRVARLRRRGGSSGRACIGTAVDLYVAA
jgi:hypothetical protein